MKKATREWLGKAEDDFLAAKALAQVNAALRDQICFHCQQSAEKHLKSLLEEAGIHIPKTHDLEKLLVSLLPQYPSLRALRRGLIFLTGFAVAIRYPGDRATKREATAALRWAGKVHEACRGLLGV